MCQVFYKLLGTAGSTTTAAVRDTIDALYYNPINQLHNTSPRPLIKKTYIEINTRW